MTGPDTIQRILSSYKFVQPIPEILRRDMHKAKKATLLAILKKRGGYGFFAFLVLAIFFQAKRFGIGLTVMKSIVAAAALSAVAAGTIIGGSYLVYTKITRMPALPVEAPDTQLETNNAETKPARIAAVYKPDFAIVPFESVGGGETAARTLSKRIADELIQTGRPKTVILAENVKAAGNADRMVIGSLIQMDRSLRLSVKVVDTRTSRITMYISETIGPKDDIGEKGAGIARRIRLEAR